MLIYIDNDAHFSKASALKPLYQFSSIHSFSDYEVLSICLNKLGQVGTYKMPWECPFFTLFPLEARDQTTWINPIKIQKVTKFDGQHYAQMTNELCLVLPVYRR